MDPVVQHLWLPVDHLRQHSHSPLLMLLLLRSLRQQRKKEQAEDPSPGLHARWEDWRKLKLDARRWAER